MLGVAPAIEAATSEDLPAVRAHLAAAGLPDVGIESALEMAVVARRDGAIVGTAAVEPYGEEGLLRSVAVNPAMRGTGVGRRLVEAAVEVARHRRIRTLYLLTETAEAWFPRFGFREIPRAALPPAVAASREAAEACADTAVAMRLDLADRRQSTSTFAARPRWSDG